MSGLPLEKFHENGVAVIENFLSEEEINDLKETALDLCKNAPDKDRVIFGKHEDKQYYLDSGNKISYFYDGSAFDADGKLIVPKERAISRLSHGLHLNHPVFEKYTFDNRIKDIAKNLGYKKPAVMQSLFIFKNPKVGSRVKQHQDASYFITDPMTVTGFWIPIEDATVNNSCLWFIKGSHKMGMLNRFVRNPDPNSRELTVYENPELNFPRDQFTACPVKRGSLVIIHGLVVHMSDQNLSDQRRCAYTFHIMDTENCKYAQENWLQYPKGQEFKRLY